jgi:hypothetical protein
MDSLSLYYKAESGDLSVHWEKHEYPKQGKISPMRAAELLRLWAEEIELMDLEGKFDPVK